MIRITPTRCVYIEPSFTRRSFLPRPSSFYYFLFYSSAMSILPLGTYTLPVSTFPSLPPIPIKFQITSSLTLQLYTLVLRHGGNHLSLPHGTNLHLKLLPLSIAQNELIIYTHLKSFQGTLIPRSYGLVHLDRPDSTAGLLLEPLWACEITEGAAEEYFVKCLRALYRLHEMGVVHNNPSPEKFILASDGSVRIHGFEKAVVYYLMRSVFFQRGVNFDLDLFEKGFGEKGLVPALGRGEMYDPRILRLPLGMNFLFLIRERRWALWLFCLLLVRCWGMGIIVDGPLENVEIICRERTRRAEGWVKLMEQKVGFQS